MAQFDLKKATIHVEDGYGPTGGLINNPTGYPIGSTTMAVDGFTVTLNNGDTFQLTGDPNTYTITGHTETLGATTSITFSPGLVVAATDDEAVTIMPHDIEIILTEGTLTYVEKKARTYVKNRGLLTTVRNADEEPVDVRTDFMWDFIRSQSGHPPTVEECFKQIGGASNWISSDPDQCAPYAVNILVYYKPNCLGTYDEKITLPDFRYEELSHDAKTGVITLTGKCNVTEATSVRLAPVVSAGSMSAKSIGKDPGEVSSEAA
jgi:hypothetical protein